MAYRIAADAGGGAADIEIFIKVTPNAHADLVGAVELQADGTLRLAVKVRAAPEDGAANKAVIKLLAKEFGIAKSALAIRRGETSRMKTVSAPDSEALRARLSAL
ncbi:MAG: DUF167 domain-containing protein [Pseudomonadota bacterium]